ncbi:DUF6344 domain-containing protein [Streptomyces sp. TRM68416]|uniref:DUF6344 domain-containing protein n=1 Tax=Streptomyces sp. TRM68416 TaxID=2758412 RepID=UPI001661F086|nr:DUF6344 domain-containing protein [Streptomyces sp. TRM68416]MBD0841089.1 hypothetical protein [Streptomyces sp. TRM68416]
MARNKVMKLWTVVVTAFLALCTTLGLVTTATAAAVPQTETTRNSDSTATAPVVAPATAYWALAHARSLPPTMKQRIGAEAHGKSPSCRHRAVEDTEAESAVAAEAQAGVATEAQTPVAAEAQAGVAAEARECGSAESAAGHR